jgi:hypothetical protein
MTETVTNFFPLEKQEVRPVYERYAQSPTHAGFAQK